MNVKKVYLTVDDIPSKDFKQKIDFLYKKSIQAILFCIGRNMHGHEDDLIYAIKKGYILGNHSFNHEDFSSISLEECKNSISKTDELIEAIYKKANIIRQKKFFRFPYLNRGGDNEAALQTYLTDLGYVQPKFEGINMNFIADKSLIEKVDVRCSFDQKEYWLDKKDAPDGMDKEENIMSRIEENLPLEGKGLNCFETTDIILIHDHEETTNLFYKIINRYVEKKIQFLNY